VPASLASARYIRRFSHLLFESLAVYPFRVSGILLVFPTSRPKKEIKYGKAVLFEIENGIALFT
jgi:uncharacterized protein YhbP (UPF0306 family)